VKPIITFDNSGSMREYVDPNDETVEQLQEILELLDRYDQIRPHTMEVIADWIDHNSSPGTGFATRPRKESAELIINWFKDQMGIQHG
jgi:hypothetical protein